MPIKAVRKRYDEVTINLFDEGGAEGERSLPAKLFHYWILERGVHLSYEFCGKVKVAMLFVGKKTTFWAHTCSHTEPTYKNKILPYNLSIAPLPSNLSSTLAWIPQRGHTLSMDEEELWPLWNEKDIEAEKWTVGSCSD